MYVNVLAEVVDRNTIIEDKNNVRSKTVYIIKNQINKSKRSCNNREDNKGSKFNARIKETERFIKRNSNLIITRADKGNNFYPPLEITGTLQWRSSMCPKQ